MTDIYYPHEYLPAPLLSPTGEYGFKPISPLKRTDLTSGRARQRRMYTSVPTQSSVKWRFRTQSEAQYFEAWYRETLYDGVSWFYMKLKTPLGVEFYKCRFIDIYDGPYFMSPRFWQYSATLELWDRPVLQSGYAQYGEYIIYSSAFDIVINKVWPSL